MQSYKVIILIATLISIELHSCLALTCTNTDGTNLQCAAGITQCFIRTDNDKVTKGCQETTSPACSGPTCFLCTTDNCNYLMCQSCINCATLDKAVDQNNVLCSKPNMLCTIHVNTTDYVVSRSCNDACGTDDSYCQNCSGDNCNIGNMPLSCRSCRSDNYAPCRQAQVGAAKCKTATVGNNKCFQGKWGDIVLRGCLSDAGPEIQQQCLNAGDSRCTTCDTFMCNDVKYNGAATLKHMSFGLILGLIYVLRQSA